MKNKIAVKLSLYFGVALVFFSIVLGTLFFVLFRNYSIQLNKDTMIQRGETIANTMAGFMSSDMVRMGGYGAYLRFVGEIAMCDVWILDEAGNIVSEGGNHGMNHMGRSVPTTPITPQGEAIAKNIFEHTAGVEAKTDDRYLNGIITVGAPIKNEAGNVIGVVLLSSPMMSNEQGASQSIVIFLISLGSSFFISIMLSLWLSRKFTNPIILKEAADALKFEQVRRDFVANVSHELKTPITVIRGSIEALRDQVITQPEDVAEYQTQIFNEVLLLERLVNDLLELSRLQNADFKIQKEQVYFGELLTDLQRRIQPLANKKNIRLEISEEADVVLLGDYQRLRQMLMIIIDNAIKFSPEGSVVQVRLTPKTLTITDAGKGIEEEELPYIFERFYKSGGKENQVGMGLGLAIAKHIASKHQIQLTAENNPSAPGCHFIFSWEGR